MEEIVYNIMYEIEVWKVKGFTKNSNGGKRESLTTNIQSILINGKDI